MPEVIRVGMAEYKIGRAPGIIVTLGLGSCVGVCAYELTLKVGGMVHIMLPNSSLATDHPVNPAKFADTALPLLLNEMEKMGVSRHLITFKMVGGAEMFTMDERESHIGVGERNIQAVEEIFQKMNLAIAAKSVGGHVGKSVSLDLETGNVEIRMIDGVILI